MIQIVPGILANTKNQFKEMVDKIKESESLKNDWVQIDFADNKFVQNLTVGIDVAKENTKDFKKEAHLMVADPINWIDDLSKADFKRIIFYQEVGQTDQIIENIKNLDLEVGLAIDIDTPFSKLEPFLDQVDLILIMSIRSGFSGQEFIPLAFEKIKEASRIRLENGFKYKIEVDGGVNPQIVKQLSDLGVDYAVMTSHLLKGDIDENLEQIWTAVRG